MLEDLCNRLVNATEAIGWIAAERSELVSPRFRGNSDDSEALRPTDARGFMLGLYPVLAVPLPLASAELVNASLRAAHNQMIIARSYLSSAQVIDAHIFFVAVEPFGDLWVQHIDAVERDETVCRKLVWMPDMQNSDVSFAAFVERSFLSRPWAEALELMDAPLDQNEQLVEAVLLEKGLGPAAARAWVGLAGSSEDDAEALVEQLVDAMDAVPAEKGA